MHSDSSIGKKNVLRRIPIITDYCYTISERQDRAPNSGVIDLHNGYYRYLTERECWRLQGYSDEDYLMYKEKIFYLIRRNLT